MEQRTLIFLFLVATAISQVFSDEKAHSCEDRREDGWSWRDYCRDMKKACVDGPDVRIPHCKSPKCMDMKEGSWMLWMDYCKHENKTCVDDEVSARCGWCLDGFREDNDGRCYDTCMYNYCAWGSTCVADGHSYFCLCPPGKMGHYCDQDDEKINRCPEVDHPEFGFLEGKCRNASWGDECVLRCFEGFEPEGQGIIACEKDGTWNSRIPTCRAKSNRCPSLKAPYEGHMAGKCYEAVEGEKCLFACDKGRKLLGENLLICGHDGKWDAPTPTCSVKDCEGLKEGSTESWSQYCERQESRACFSDPKEGPKCGCQPGLSEVCVCTRNRQLLQGFLNKVLEGKSKK